MGTQAWKVVIALYAYFFSTEGRRCRLWQEEVRGMPLVRLEVPRHPSLRQCRSLERTLERLGVHCLLNAPDHWPGTGLPPVLSTQGLWWTNAPRAALLLLEQAGIDPRRAVVELCGARLTPTLEATLLALAPRVRGISLSLPDQEAVSWRMQRELGLAPLRGVGDLALCAVPVSRPRAMELWHRQPRPPGLGLACPDLSLPEGCPTAPALEALQSQGLLHPSEIQVRRIFT